jgi:hypothetical protein
MHVMVYSRLNYGREKTICENTSMSNPKTWLSGVSAVEILK